MAYASAHRYSELELWTWEISTQSRRFYEKMGFTLTTDRGLSGYPGISPDADVTVRYVKPVDAHSATA